MNQRTRTFNSKRNIIVGLTLAVVSTIIAFVVRTIFIKTLGDDLLGVNSLFVEVISIMSLAELGFGMAIIYKLYAPIRDNDQDKIAQYMNLYKKIYYIVAGVFVLIGAAMVPFVHLLVKDVEIDVWYLRLVFGMFVIQTAASYLLSYKSSLLIADQKNFIISIFTFIAKTICAGAAIALLLLTKNYIVYLGVQIAQAIMINLSIAIYVNKKYPFLRTKNRLSKEEKKATFKDVGNIFIKRLSGVVTSSTDNVLISTLVSTVLVGFYSNYVMIFSVVRLIKREMTSGVGASIGNLSVTADADKNIQVLKRLTFIYFVFASIMCAGLMALSSLFVGQWLGVDHQLSIEIVYIAIFVLFLEIVCEPLWQYLEVSGLFSLDKYIGIIGSVVNLIVSIILGLYIGIAGIFIGTICTQVIQITLKIFLIFKKKYFKSPGRYFLVWGKALLGYAAIVAVSFFLIEKINFANFYLTFFTRGFAALFLGIAASLLPFICTDEIKYTFSFMNRIFHKKPKTEEATNETQSDSSDNNV